LGGKNSKEILGECRVRWPSKAGGVTSVMALTKLRKGGQASGLAARS
jgi:hypothetical protein